MHIRIMLFLFLIIFSKLANANLKNTDDRFTEQHKKELTYWIKQNYPNKLSNKEISLLTNEVFTEAKNKKIDPLLLFALISQESSFNPKVTHKGAKGLMQVQYKIHKKKFKGKSPYELKVNIEVGTQILKDCMIKNKTEKKALLCYSGNNFNHAVKVERIKSSLTKHLYQTKRK